MEWIVLVVGGLLIGLTLGLMGSGGSILTVPILVYLVGHQDKVAIAESLAIVGGIALISVIPYAYAGEVHWRSVIFFGIPGMLGTYAGAWLSQFLPGAALLILFAVILFVASALMLRKDKRRPIAKDPLKDNGSPRDEEPHHPHPLWQIIGEGLIVGIVTGLVGVGGGFLIVPALVLLGGLPMRLAIGTSLAVIAMKSFSGFYKHVVVLQQHAIEYDFVLDWRLIAITIAVFIAFGVLGSLAGRSISMRIDQGRLRTAFAIFLVVMGIVILGTESYKLIRPAGEQPNESAVLTTTPDVVCEIDLVAPPAEQQSVVRSRSNPVESTKKRPIRRLVSETEFSADRPFDYSGALV